MHSRTAVSTLLALLIPAACADTTTGPIDQPLAAFAKGGTGKPPAITYVPVSVTLHEGGDLLSDGNGAYTDGECGVSANFLLRSDGNDGMQLYPESTASGCPRTATVRLVARHPSANPDDHTGDSSAPLGTFFISQIKLQLDGRVAVINAAEPAESTAPTSCYDVDKRGRIKGGTGLRFDPANFPMSDNLQAAWQDENGHTRVQSRPFPDNLAGCESNGVISYWHVNVDMTIAEK